MSVYFKVHKKSIKGFPIYFEELNMLLGVALDRILAEMG